MTTILTKTNGTANVENDVREERRRQQVSEVQMKNKGVTQPMEFQCT